MSDVAFIAGLLSVSAVLAAAALIAARVFSLERIWIRRWAKPARQVVASSPAEVMSRAA